MTISRLSLIKVKPGNFTSCTHNNNQDFKPQLKLLSSFHLLVILPQAKTSTEKLPIVLDEEKPLMKAAELQ